MNYIIPFFIQQNSEKTYFAKSNYVYFSSMPCLYPMKNDKNEYVVKHLTNNDWYTDKMKSIKDIEYFSLEYLNRSLDLPDVELVLDSIFFSPTSAAKTNPLDHTILNETNKFVEEHYEDSKSKTNVYKIKKGKQGGNLVHVNDLLEDEHYLNLRKKQIDNQMRLNSSESLYYNGIIKFKDYESKIEFLNTGAAYFGIKAYKNVTTTFIDADFANIIMIISSEYIGVPASQVLDQLNRIICKKDPSKILEQCKFTHDFANRLFLEPRVRLRFNSFVDAYNVSEILKSATEFKSIICFSRPRLKYYNGYFVNSFDMMVKNSVTNLDKVLTVKSDYATRKLLKIN
jgi:hypothetical protein